MDAFVFDMLSLLKARFEAAGGASRYQVGEAGRDVSARQFYLARLEDNLVRPLSARHRAEYARGSGGELEGKMNALRSSSAMTFNLLGNGRCELEGGGARGAGRSLSGILRAPAPHVEDGPSGEPRRVPRQVPTGAR